MIMSANITETNTTSVQDALRTGRQRELVLVGQLDRNQGLPTFTGRMTLEQFSDLTVVHNRKWADEAGETLDIVTQREIIDPHVNGLATFILQGLVAATTKRVRDEESQESLGDQLERIQDRIGRGAHYGLPQVTLVLPGQPDVRLIQDKEEVVAARLMLPAGRLFVVADGQHRREASRRVREFLNEVIGNRRIPRSCKFYPVQDSPLSSEEVEAWVAVQETFRSWTLVSYEAHIDLSVAEARQMFTNYNCNVKPVKKELNLAFDQSNPINVFGKEWVRAHLATSSSNGAQEQLLDLSQIAVINGFLFLGKTSIKSAPYNVDEMVPIAKEFWTHVLQSSDWNREGTLLRDVPVLKGLAKSWFYVFLAKRNSQLAKAEKLRAYIRRTQFDKAWMEAVPGLAAHTVPAENAVGFRFSPAHNDIVAKISAHALG
jgi:DNA-sulfur modification-associated